MGVSVGAAAAVSRSCARAAAGPFRLHAFEHAPSQLISAYTHFSFQILCVIAGSLIEGAAGRENECGPGTIVLKPEAGTHWIQSGAAGCRTLAVSWNAETSPTITERLGPWDDVRVSRFPPASVLARRIHAELLRGFETCPLQLEGLTLELLATIARPPEHSRCGRIPDWLRRAREALRDELAEFRGLRPLAARVGVHPVHLSRAHRAVFGCTVGEYLREIRIARAKRLLLATDETIAQIASTLGFADQAHLTRLFRRYTGTTPAAYRRRGREGRSGDHRFACGG